MVCMACVNHLGLLMAAHLCCHSTQGCPQVGRCTIQAQAGTSHALCSSCQASQAGLGRAAACVRSRLRTQQLHKGQLDGQKVAFRCWPQCAAAPSTTHPPSAPT